MKKRLVTAVLMLCLAFSLVACGGNGGSNDTEKNNTQQDSQADKDTEKESEKESEKTGATYTIKVVDEANAPVAGVMVQLCKDSCVPKMTDANGIAEFTVAEIAEGYKANVAKAPEGYVYEDGDVYFENGATELTLVLKAAQ